MLLAADSQGELARIGRIELKKRRDMGFFKGIPKRNNTGSSSEPRVTVALGPPSIPDIQPTSHRNIYR